MHPGLRRVLRSDAARAAAASCAAILAAALLASCAAKDPEKKAPPVALVVTPPESVAPAAFRAARELAAADAERIGKAAEFREAAGAAPAPAALVRHVALPDSADAGAGAEALSAALLKAADDKLVRAILVAPAPPGTAEAFRELRAKRRDILLVAAESADGRLEIEAAADLVVELDRLYRPYLAVKSAKEAGARRFFAVAAAGAAGEARSRERAVLRAACTEFKIAYRLATASLPDTNFGWLGTLDRDCALYCADSALAAAVAEAALATGACVVDGGPDSLEAWREVLAAGLPDDYEKADAAGRLRRVEKAATVMAGRGRLAAWTRGYAAESVLGLAEFARALAAGSARIGEAKDLAAALELHSTGGAWIVGFDVDAETGVKAANHVLLRQDPYVFGRGYEQSAFDTVPPAYLRIGPAAP